MTDNELTIVVEAYLQAALFTTCNDDEEYFETLYSVEDFTEDARHAAEEDCELFIERLKEATTWDTESEYANLFEAAIDVQSLEHIGHDLWMTRNHHGCGFWDGDYDNFGDAITQIVAQYFGELYAYETEDGKLDME